MEKIKNLLNQVQILIKKSDDILDATGARFNMFRTLGVNHYENTHSAILAEFLNPQGSHSLKDEFLRKFVSQFCENFVFDTKKAKVTVEKSTEEGRMDIVIENGRKAIIIENKVYAGDQPEQLKRYEKHAKSYRDGHVLIYLTLYGDDASDQSGKGVQYTSISYRHHIVEWLEECAKIAYNKPMVRETLNQYINHINWLTGTDMETEKQDEIVKLLAKKENFATAAQIYNLMGDVDEELFKGIFQPYLRDRLKSINCELPKFNEDWHLTKFYGFYVKPKRWHNCKIKFQFDKANAQGFAYGIAVDSDFKIGKRIQNKLNNLDGYGFNNSWYCSKSVDNHRNWTESKEYLMMYDKNSSLYNEIVDCVKDIIEKTKELDI